MQWSFTLGRIGGTAVRIHFTFILLLIWIAGAAYFSGGATAALDSTLFIVLLFACVLLHEFGHILVARRFGIQTPDVTLLPIGGVASLERIPENPRQELLVAIAGPAVNLVIAAVLLIATGLFMPADMMNIGDPRVSLIARLIGANIFLALFNLIPAYPMDGGRVLHAILSMRMSPTQATRIAASIGQGFAFVLGFLGLFGNPLLVFVAIFIYVAAASESRGSEFVDLTKGLTVKDAMETRFATVPITALLSEAVDTLLASAQHEFPIIDGQGKPVGLLVREDLIKALKDRDPQSSVAEVMRVPVPLVAVGADLGGAVQQMQTGNLPAISVVDADGALVGLMTRENVAEMAAIRSARPDWVFARKTG